GAPHDGATTRCPSRKQGSNLRLTWRMRPRSSEALLRLRSRNRLFVERFHVNIRAVEHWKSAILSLEREAQIRAPEHNCVGTPYPAQVLTDREECASLRISDATRDRHLDV